MVLLPLVLLTALAAAGPGAACPEDAAWAALESTRDTVELACGLDVVRQLVAGHETGWSADSVDQLFREAAKAGYPAMHHSDAFEAAYHPAYRVVS